MEKEEAKKEILRVINELGIDSEKISGVMAFKGFMEMYLTEKWSIETFKENCEKLAILNPKLRKG